MRTFPLVAIASCGLVQTAISVLGANATVNANIMQGVVTGIGFIGAGAIIRQGDFTARRPGEGEIMVASKDTVKLIFEVIKRHVTDDQMQAIIEDLLGVPGNKSFRDTIERLAALAERDR